MRKGISVILLAVSVLINAQDFGLPDLSNYQHNWMIYNPAFTGTREVLSASFFTRAKRFSEPGGPFYMQGSIHSPVKNEKLALGVSIYSKNDPAYFGSLFTSPVNEQSIYANYAYRIFAGGGRVSFGLSAGISLYNQNLEQLPAVNAVDPILFPQDDLKTPALPNFGAGVLYYTDIYFVGLSVPRFFSRDENNKFTSGFNYFKPVLTGGYEFVLNKNFTVSPSFYLEYGIKDNTLAYATSLNIALLDQRLWFGTIYKAEKRISFNTNIEVNPKVMLGLSYDYSLDPALNYFHGSWELVLRYEWRKIINSNIPFYY